MGTRFDRYLTAVKAAAVEQKAATKQLVAEPAAGEPAHDHGDDQITAFFVGTKNRFEALGERVWSVGAVEIEMPLEQINAVESKRMENLRPAGRGKITIDSGAAESVLPADMLPNEKLMDGEAKKRGVRYVAANGGKMDNLGEKKVRFRRQGSAAVSSIMFQVTDVGKPLASVSRILDKGNIVVFSRKGSYIMNEAIGEKIPIQEEKGTFIMDVVFLEPAVKGFTGQGK